MGVPEQPEAWQCLLSPSLTPLSSPCSGVGVMPSWREQREGAGGKGVGKGEASRCRGTA